MLQALNKQVNSLVLERRHRFRDVTEVSSFGPGVFCHYDIALMLQPNGAGSTVRMFDPGVFMPINLDDGIYGDVKDGIFHDGLRPNEGDRTVSELRLSTDWAGAGTLTPAIDTARSAVVKSFDGRKLIFDVFDLGPVVGAPVVGAPPWMAIDVGRTGRSGQTTWSSGVFTEKASGADIWGTSDSFHYAYQALRGDGSLTIHLNSLTPTSDWTKAGVMIRQSLSPIARHAFIMATPSHGFNFHARPFTTGSVALKCQGVANGGTATNATFKVIDLAATPLTVTSGLALSYWVYPLDDNGRYVALDFHCTDGTTLHASSAKDQGGFSLAASAGHGGAIALNAWSEIRSNLGAVAGLAGKQIDRIWVSFDRAGATGQFGSYLDDLTLMDPVANTGFATGLEQGDRQPTWQSALDTDLITTGNPSNVTGVPPLTAAICNLTTSEQNHSGATLALASRSGAAPCWLRISRQGAALTGATSVDGATWSTLGSVTMPLGQDVYIGMAATAHLYSATTTVVANQLVLGGTPTPAGQWPPTGLGLDRRGRLSRIIDRNGYATTLTYRYNPFGHPATDSTQQAAIAQSPDLQWQLNTITDAQNRTVTFAYGAQQVSTRWAVQSITLPDGVSKLTYTYTNGNLSRVDQPDGTASTFSSSLDPVTGCMVMQYFEATEEGTHRAKSAYLTSNFTEFVHGSYDSVFSQSSLIVRAMVNGAGELTYANIGDPSDFSKTVIFEAGTLRENNFTSSRYYLKGWTKDPTKGYDGITGDLEPNYVSDNLGSWSNYHRSTPVGTTSSKGRYLAFGYDSETFRNKTTFQDGSTLVVTRNGFKEPLRVQDRQNHVKLFTYDSLGNLLTREEGLIVSGSTDIHAPEYAKYQYLYYPAGDPNQYLKQADIDANGNRTDYTYDANHRLWKVQSPPDVVGGTRAVTIFAYDTSGRLQTLTDALNRVTTYHYDGRNRIDLITYADGSTETFTFGSGANANLLTRKTDRNGVITAYFYDLAGRVIRTETGALVKSSPFVDPATIAVVQNTYVPGTELVATRLVNGELTSYDYDHRNRLIATTVHPRQGVDLITRTDYQLNRPWRTTDPYGRDAWSLYDQDSRVVRTIRQQVPTVIPGLSPDANGIVDGATYVIYSPVTKKGLSTLSHSTTAGSAIVQWSQDGLADQRWLAVANGDGTYHLLNAESGLSLDVNGASTADNAPTVQNPWDGRISERFTITKDSNDSQVCRITALNSGKCLEPTGMGKIDGTAIVQTTDAGRRTQRWVMGLVILPTAGANLARVIPDQDPPYVIEDSNYDAFGHLVGQVDPRGVNAAFAYDSRDRIVSTVRADRTADACRTEFRYDAQGNRTQEIQPRSFVYNLATKTFGPAPEGSYITAATYTGRNLTASMTAASGSPDAGTTSFTYTLTGMKATETDANGFATTYTYGTCCDWLKDVIDPQGFITHYEYDFTGKMVSVTDANNLTTLTHRDSRYRTVSQTNGAGEKTTFSFDDNLTDGAGLDAAYAAAVAGLGLGSGADGSAMLVTNPAGEKALTIMDGLGRTVRTVDAGGHQTTMLYDDALTSGLLATAIVDALGHTRVQRTDGAGRARQQVDALGKTTLTAFDANGNVVSQRDPNAIGWDGVYDNLNRLTKRTDTAGAVTATVFDAQGNPVKTLDALQAATLTAYDFRNRKKTVTDRIQAVTTFAYDKVGNMLTITDAEGSVTAYTFDSRNLLITELYPIGQQTSAPGTDKRTYTYDPGRRLKTRLDQAGVTTTYNYDGANRLIGRVYSTGVADGFTYDSASRLKTAVSGRHGTTVTRIYNSEGLLDNEVQNLGEASFTVRYGYDADHRTTTVTYPDGKVVTRAYTDRDQLQQVWYDGASVALRGYDNGGRLLTTAFANGRTETRGYVPNDNLAQTITVPTVTAFTYAYDADKRKTSEADGISAVNSQGFGYDAADRLTTWGGAGNTQSWDLSPVGDWKDTTRNGVVETREHTKVHETTRTTTGSVATDLLYDKKGNLTKDLSGAVYSWDEENRLLTATVQDSTLGMPGMASYRYDALGRRLQKVVFARATTFVHDGAQVVYEAEGPQRLPPTAAADDGTMNGTPPGGAIIPDALVRVNFQPVDTPIPSGFVADKGKAQGARSNGFTYGWNAARTTTGVVRGESPYPQFDTFIQDGTGTPPSGAGTWKLALTNGTYAVAVVMGDAASLDQTDNVSINGAAQTDLTPAITTPPSSNAQRGNFDVYMVNATVSDGYLTLTVPTTAKNPKLCFIEVGKQGSSIDQATRDRASTLVGNANSYTGTSPFPPRSNQPRSYVYGTYVDEPLMLVAASVKYYCHANHLYSVMALTDGTGAVAEKYLYDAYGRPTIMSGTGAARARSAVGNTVGFTGYHIDLETGLYYARARMYSPGLGRFVGRDPYRQIILSEMPYIKENGYIAQLPFQVTRPKAKDGYHDGMGLYAGTFVPNKLDPSGMAGILQGANCIPVSLMTFGGITFAQYRCKSICADTPPCSKISSVPLQISMPNDPDANWRAIALAQAGNVEAGLNGSPCSCGDDGGDGGGKLVYVPTPYCDCYDTEKVKRAAIVATELGGGIAVGYMIYKCVKVGVTIWQPELILINLF